MNYKLFVKSYQGLRITAAFLFALTFLLSISCVFLSFKMFNYSETIVLVPPHLNERVKVALNKSDIGYTPFDVKLTLQPGEVVHFYMKCTIEDVDYRTAEDIIKVKPNPEGFLKAMKHFALLMERRQKQYMTET